MNDVVYPYNGILLSNKKQHTVVINLEIIVLNQRSHTKKRAHVYLFPFIKNSRKCKLISSDGKEISGCLETMVERGLDYKGARGKF